MIDPTFIHLQNIGRMVECGVHSGLPACCVKFFITDITWMTSTQSRNYRGKIKLRSDALGIVWGYIPCSNCLRDGKVVKVLPCPENSHCGYIIERPENIPSVEDTDRPLAHRLKRTLATFLTGFYAIRNGSIPIDGFVADHMEKTLVDTTIVIDRAINDMRMGYGETQYVSAKSLRNIASTHNEGEEVLKMIRANRLLLKNITLENKR